MNDIITKYTFYAYIKIADKMSWLFRKWLDLLRVVAVYFYLFYSCATTSKELKVKQWISMLLLLSGAQAFAVIQNSQMEARHQTLIEQAITEACGYYRDLTDVKTTVRPVLVDQGITDRYYFSVFNFTVRVDNSVFDQYQAFVESAYFDNYDHQSGNWGTYQVKSVSCRPL